MTPRRYGQPCSLAGALDRIGERWSLLIVRELSLGPLRFSDLVRSVGGAPTDVLTRRLRDLEREGIVGRRELGPPAQVSVYELTDLGRGLERPMVELGRWGLNFHEVADVRGLAPTSLPSALRIMLQPPRDVELTLALRCDGQRFTLRIEDGWIAAARGETPDADLTLAGSAPEVIAALVAGEAEDAIEVEGDREHLDALRAMVVLPERLREAALAEISARAAARR